MRELPVGRRWRMVLMVPILLVAALFFFEWLGSERPQKMVEIEVQPAAAVVGNKKSMKN